MEYITIEAEKVHEAYDFVENNKLQNCLNWFYPGTGTIDLLLGIDQCGITYCATILEKTQGVKMDYNDMKKHDSTVVYAPIALGCRELLYLCKMLPVRGNVRIPVLYKDVFNRKKELSFERINNILRHDAGAYVYADILAMCAVLNENPDLDGVFESLIYNHVSIKNAISRVKRDGVYAARVYSHETNNKFVKKNKLQETNGRGWRAKIIKIEAGRWSNPYCSLHIIYNENEDYEWEEGFYGGDERQFKKKIRALQYQDLVQKAR